MSHIPLFYVPYCTRSLSHVPLSMIHVFPLSMCSCSTIRVFPMFHIHRSTLLLCGFYPVQRLRVAPPEDHTPSVYIPLSTIHDPRPTFFPLYVSFVPSIPYSRIHVPDAPFSMFLTFHFPCFPRSTIQNRIVRITPYSTIHVPRSVFHVPHVPLSVFPTIHFPRSPRSIILVPRYIPHGFVYLVCVCGVPSSAEVAGRTTPGRRGGHPAKGGGVPVSRERAKCSPYPCPRTDCPR